MKTDDSLEEIGQTFCDEYISQTVTYVTKTFVCKTEMRIWICQKKKFFYR